MALAPLANWNLLRCAALIKLIAQTAGGGCAVLVALDTLEVPIYQHERFPAHQAGREFFLEHYDPDIAEYCRNFLNTTGLGPKERRRLSVARHRLLLIVNFNPRYLA